MSEFIRKHLKSIKRLEINEFNRENYLTLDKNENTQVLSRKLFSRIKKINFSKKIKLYPVLNDTYNLISKKFKINRKNILLTHGSDIGIKMIYETYLENKQTVMIQKPSYAMTEIYAKLFGAKIKFYSINDKLEIDYPQLHKTIKHHKVKIIFIETPNGFTGQEVNKADLVKILNYTKKKKILIVLDEAY